MKCNSVSIRAFNTGGFIEIVLPNKKKILIDPSFIHYDVQTGQWTDKYENGLTREDITGVDYILLTHSHWDHDLDIGYFVEKCRPLVFCSAFCAEEILKYHHIPYDNLIPVYPNSQYHIEDFTLDVIQSKHNSMGARTFEDPCRLAEKAGVFDHSRCDQLGNMDSVDYMITTNNHFSILMTGGTIVWNNIFDFCRKRHPNLLIRQGGVRRNGEQIPPAEMAELLRRYQAQIVMPFHQEFLIKQKGAEWTREYFRQVAEHLRAADPGMAFVYPETGRWYDIGIDVSLQ